MPDQETLTPNAYLRASKVGTLVAIPLLAWAIFRSVNEPKNSSPAYWVGTTAVGILLIAVPCWLVGRRARREYLENLKKQDSAD